MPVICRHRPCVSKQQRWNTAGIINDDQQTSRATWVQDLNPLCADIVSKRHEHILEAKMRKKLLTCWMVLKITIDIYMFCTISWILFNRRRANTQWSNSTCCLSYTVNTMKPGDLESQDIIRHGIEQINSIILSLASEELIRLGHTWQILWELILFIILEHSKIFAFPYFQHSTDISAKACLSKSVYHFTDLL